MDNTIHFFQDLYATYEKHACKEDIDSQICLALQANKPYYTKSSWLTKKISSIFTKVSFETVSNSKIVVQQANHLLQSIQSNRMSDEQPELAAAIKICSVQYRILSRLEKENKLGQEKESEIAQIKSLKGQNFNTIQSLIECFAMQSNKSHFEIALQYRSPDYAYTILEKDLPHIPELQDKSLYTMLIPILIKKMQYSVILRILGKNILVQNYSIPIADLTEHALSMNDQEGILTLLQSGLDPKYITNKGLPLIAQACRLGMEKVVEELILKKAATDYVDEHGNTLLHTAVQKCKGSMAKLFKKSVNPFKKNNDGRTALEMLFCCSNTIFTIAQKKRFLDEFLERPVHAENNCTMSPITIDTVCFKLSSCAAVEFAYLLNNNYTVQILSNLPREDVENTTETLLKIFPKEAIYNTFFSLYQVSDDHYKMKIKQCIPGPIPHGIKIEQFLTLFDSLHLDDPDKKQRTGLEKYLNKIKDREEFLGTPIAGSNAIEVFYSQIETHICHTIASLIKKNDRELTHTILKEFINASGYCGGRYYAVALDSYLRVCHDAEQTPTAKFLSSIGQFRSLCLQNASIANMSDSNSVHNYNRALKSFLGSKYNVPGHDQAIYFNDMYIGQDYNVKEIEERLLQYYTSHTIAVEWLLPIIQKDTDGMRDIYIDSHKEHVPEYWEKEKYSKIYRELEQTRKLESDTQTKEQKIKKLLEINDIYVKKGQSIENAINEDRIFSYIQEKVYDETGNFRIQAYVYLLEKMGVLTSKLKWNDPKLKVQVINYQDNTTLITKITSTVISTISNFISKILS